MPGWRKSLMLEVRDFLIRVFFYVIEYYSVMFYNVKKLHEDVIRCKMWKIINVIGMLILTGGACVRTVSVC